MKQTHSNHDHAQYEIIQNYPQNAYTQAIAFNSDGTLMVIGCANRLKIFQFKDGCVKKLQEIQNSHNFSIDIICFYNNKNQFLSSGEDQKIKLWKQFKNQTWQLIQTLEGHDYQVPSLIINKNDSEFISCSFDGCIKIWNQNQEYRWNCIQTLDKVSRGISSICYNQSETQLVSCGFDDKIILWQIDSNREWKLRQVIIDNPFGSRICFAGDDQIIFQPQSGPIRVFEYFEEQQKFVITENPLQWENADADVFLFPIMYFNENHNLLIDKQGQNVYVMKKYQNKFRIEQIIEFKSIYLYGTLTKNAEYLVTWDFESELLQVRKLKLI